MIVDGRIKLKSRTEPKTFTKTGLKLTDGSELDADVVVFATGLVLSLFGIRLRLKIGDDY
jgi:cation diffusion facilitator CzcD-associated flavoprotein CzcO